MQVRFYRFFKNFCGHEFVRVKGWCLPITPYVKNNSVCIAGIFLRFHVILIYGCSTKIVWSIEAYRLLISTSLLTVSEVTAPSPFAAYRSLVVQLLFVESKLSFALHWKFFFSIRLCFAVAQRGSILAHMFSENCTLHDSYRRYCSSNATANSGPPSGQSLDSVHSRNELSHFAHAEQLCCRHFNFFP